MTARGSLRSSSFQAIGWAYQFSEKASVVRSLANFDSSKLDEILQKPGCLDSNLGNTPIFLAGLKLAATCSLPIRAKTQAVDRASFRRKMEPDPKVGNARASPNSSKPVGAGVKNRGMHIYTLAFSEDADKVFYPKWPH